MKMRTMISLLLASAVATASVAIAEDQGGTTAAKKPEATKSATHHSGTMHHMKLTKDEITGLQNALAKSGEFKGKVDGTLGKETEEALRAYQKTNSLKVTGQPDPETLTKLGLPVPTQTATMGATEVPGHQGTAASATKK